MGAQDGSALRGEAWLTPHGMSGMEAATGKAGAGGEFAKQASQWMTPNVPNGGRHVPPELIVSKGMTEGGQKRTVGLESQTKYWATPTSSDNSNRTTQIAPSHGITHGLVLAGQAASWPTPRGTDGTKGGPNQAGSKGDLMLPSATAQWNANFADTSFPSDLAATDVPTAKDQDLTMWPTPAARDAKGANSEQHATVTGGGRKHMDQLANFVAYSPLAQPTRAGQESSATNPGSPPPSASKANSTPRLLSRRLNPYFAERLMGWPLGWTSTTAPHASSASATASWRCALRQRLSCLFGEPGCSPMGDRDA